MASKTTAKEIIRQLEKEMFDTDEPVIKIKKSSEIINFVKEIYPDRKVWDRENKIISSCSALLEAYCAHYQADISLRYLNNTPNTGPSSQLLELIQQCKKHIEELIDLIEHSNLPE